MGLLFIIFIISMGSFFYLRHNAGEYLKLPPSSSPEGKRVRIIGVAFLVTIIVLFGYHLHSSKDDALLWTVSVQGVIIGMVIVAVRVLLVRKK